MHLFAGMFVLFRVRDPASAGRELDVSTTHTVEFVLLTAAFSLATFAEHAISVCEFAAQDVAKDLGVAVRVRGKAGLWSDAVLVQNSQCAEGRVAGVEVGGEGEGVVGV